MKFIRNFILIIIILILISSISYAQEERIIEEIVITGLTRSDESLVKKQLPYSVGDEWNAELKGLTEEKLMTTFIFDPFSLDVSTETVTRKKVRVIINAEDSNIFMIHPVLFGVFKTIDLASSQLNQTIINPFGNGLSISGGFSWKNDNYDNDSSGPWWKIGARYLGAKGRVYSWEYKDFENHKDFNDLKYKTEGVSQKISLEVPFSTKLSSKSELLYQTNDYLVKDIKVEQEYLVLANQLNYSEAGTSIIKTEYGLSLADKQADFKKLAIRWNTVSSLNENNKLIYSLKGGVASDNTPVNFQFQGGGYSDIPLRGHGYELAGTKYLTGNLEWHKRIFTENLWTIAFIDGGKIVAGKDQFSETDWMADGGLGLAYETFLGPLRTDVGFDLINDNTTFNLTLGHTF